jgi:hypothetical protein
MLFEYLGSLMILGSTRGFLESGVPVIDEVLWSDILLFPCRIEISDSNKGSAGAYCPNGI